MNHNTKPTSWPFTNKAPVAVTVEFAKVNQGPVAGDVLIPAEQVSAPLFSYYGRPSVFAHKGHFFMGLGDVSGATCVEISEALYKAFVADFGPLEVPAYSDESGDDEGFEVIDAKATAKEVDEALAMLMGDDGDDE